MFAYTRTRTPSPLYSEHDADPYYTRRRLVRTNSKRAYADEDDDDDEDEEHDDYPYTTNAHKKPSLSRALAIRPASQLEKYNIWSRPSVKPSSSSKYRYDGEEDTDRGVRYKYTRTRYSASPEHEHEGSDREREREFEVNVRASFSRPSSSHRSERRAMAWGGDVFRRKEKWVDEERETREREGSFGFGYGFGEERGERSVRVRRVKRTRTEEWRPLSGFRR